jgi:hypothetical protein
MLASLFGYLFSMITVLTAAVVVLTSFSNISMIGNGRHHLRPPVIDRTVTVELQRHSTVAKVEAPSQDVSPVVAHADAKASKPHKLARQHNNYERPGYYGNALSYAEASRNGPQRLFANW